MLTINQSNRYILKDGIFFPYLADTAWTMLQRLSREEIVFYLDKRVEQGFNAVQVSAVSELGGLMEPNREGYLSFYDADPTKPDDRYFSIVEFLADECEKRGMVLTLLPTWGDKFNLKWGSGPEVFTPANAYFYGKYIARVIGKRENVIWMLGGDRPLETEIHRRIIDEMAKGIREGESVRHLITYHPNGEHSSADFLNDAEYIDFHTIQSSHDFGGFHSELMVFDTINKTEKPTIDAECFYEDFPIGFQLDWGYRFSPLDIRRRIYKNMLSGAFGHTYGHQSVWCFRNEKDEEYLYSWEEALDRPAAQQMRHINQLLGKVDITSYKPSEIAHNAVSCGGDGFALVYAENTEPIFIDLSEDKTYAQMQWFDPVTGVFEQKVSCKKAHISVTSPFGHDGILIIYFDKPI